MKLSDVSIRRPVLASMLSVGAGPLRDHRLYPPSGPGLSRRRPPDHLGHHRLPGADPQVVESAVTDVLEEELSTVAGLRTLTSSSAEQLSNITLEFTLDRDVDVVVAGRPGQGLPGPRPVAARHRGAGGGQAGGRCPAVLLDGAFGGQLRPAYNFSDIADRRVKARLQSLSGVGSAQIFGERRFSMRVWLSAPELAARGLTVQDVESAIRSRNVEVPAGRIESDRREFSVRSLGELKTPLEFERPGGDRPGRPAGPAQATWAGWSWAPRTSAARSASTATPPSPSAWCASRRPT